MAQFDMSKTVENILSGRGEAAQKLVGTVIKNAADLASVPGVDMAKLAGLEGALGAVSDIGGRLGVGAPKRPAATPKKIPKSQFSPFDMDCMNGAMVMASKLMEIAERKGGDAGLADAIGTIGSLGELVGGARAVVGDLVGDLTGQVSEVARAVGPDMLASLGLRQYALELFITHYPAAREKFKLGSVEQRQPNLACRARARATPPEDRLSYWREDTQHNDHHGHWHIVYPPFGRPVPGGDPDLGDRHGELFAYMHGQMLARYDAERLGVGLPKVQPFDDYRAPIPEGYDPGDLMKWDGETWMAYRPRAANAKLSDLAVPPPDDWANNRPGRLLDSMEKFRKALFEAGKRGTYEIDGKQIPLTSDNFGNTEEANPASVDWPVRSNPRDPKNGNNYGGHHNDGHVHFAFFDNKSGPFGVMGDTDVAVRDPIFWRWHRHVDNIIQTWRETLGKQEPHDFTDGPPVTVRSEDIILCGQEGLPAGFDGAKHGAEAFGYSEDVAKNRWDKKFLSDTVTLADGKQVKTTAELVTEMRTRTIQVYDSVSGKNVPEKIDYLSHDDFFYFLRLQNNSEQAQQVTVRIFLAPEPWIEDITSWIEMDRFQRRLAGRERAVIFRPARQSAVIRKPALGHAELEKTEPRTPVATWCDCGWPYNLLLPRGTKDGLSCRLLVMVSRNDLVMPDTSQECTSMSYCGLQDQEYPDKRPMGYPFDRSLAGGISATIDKHDNWAVREIKIRCRSL
ncbi:MAG: tyrosinase family protein [Pseudonocardiaceae bacterium]